MKTRFQVFPLFLTAVLLAFGLSVYLFDRPADRIYFVPDGWQLSAGNDLLFGFIGAHLPSFVHVAVFILVTAIILAPWRFRIASICLLWFVIDSLFEIAQHELIAARIAAIVPNWFEDKFFLENTAAHFLNGTFDLLDIVSIALGSVVAYLVLQTSRVQEEGYDGKQ